jgi:hypothetical protein
MPTLLDNNFKQKYKNEGYSIREIMILWSKLSDDEKKEYINKKSLSSPKKKSSSSKKKSLSSPKKKSNLDLENFLQYVPNDNSIGSFTNNTPDETLSPAEKENSPFYLPDRPLNLVKEFLFKPKFHYGSLHNFSFDQINQDKLTDVTGCLTLLNSDDFFESIYVFVDNKDSAKKIEKKFLKSYYDYSYKAKINGIVVDTEYNYQIDYNYMLTYYEDDERYIFDIFDESIDYTIDVLSEILPSVLNIDLNLPHDYKISNLYVDEKFWNNLKPEQKSKLYVRNIKNIYIFSEIIYHPDKPSRYIEDYYYVYVKNLVDLYGYDNLTRKHIKENCITDNIFYDKDRINKAINRIFNDLNY